MLGEVYPVALCIVNSQFSDPGTYRVAITKAAKFLNALYPEYDLSGGSSITKFSKPFVKFTGFDDFEHTTNVFIWIHLCKIAH